MKKNYFLEKKIAQVWAVTLIVTLFTQIKVLHGNKLTYRVFIWYSLACSI